MTEEVTIKIRTEVENGDLEQYRESLSKTQKEAERTADSARKVGKQASSSASELSKIGRDLGSISPTLGKITKNVTLLSKSFQQLGLNLKKLRFGRNGRNSGPLDTGNGDLNRNAGAGATGGRMGRIGKIGAVVGIASIGASLLGGLGGGAKLAGFDKLNAIGQPSIIDFLDPHLKKIRNLLGENGGLGEALSGLSMSNPVVKLVQLLSGNVTDTIGHWFDGAIQASTSLFNSIASSVSSIGNTIGNWFSNLTAPVFGGIMAIADAIGNIIGHWFDRISASPFHAILSIAGDIGNVIGHWFDGLYSEGKRTFDYIASQAQSILSTIRGWFDTPSSSSNEPTDAQKQYARDLYNQMAGNSTSGNSTAKDSGSWLDKEYTDPVTSAINSALGNGTIGSGVSNATAISNSVEALSLLAGGAGGTVSKIVSKVGSALGKVGSAIGDVFGGIGKAFGFAEGGVFMPNRPQLAILGDNRTEPEAVAPYSLIVRAVGDALRESKTIGDAKTQPTTIEVPVSLNGKVIARAIYDDLDNERKRRNGVIV